MYLLNAPPLPIVVLLVQTPPWCLREYYRTQSEAPSSHSVTHLPSVTTNTTVSPDTAGIDDDNNLDTERDILI